MSVLLETLARAIEAQLPDQLPAGEAPVLRSLWEEASPLVTPPPRPAETRPAPAARESVRFNLD